MKHQTISYGKNGIISLTLVKMILKYVSINRWLEGFFGCGGSWNTLFNSCKTKFQISPLLDGKLVNDSLAPCRISHFIRTTFPSCSIHQVNNVRNQVVKSKQWCKLVMIVDNGIEDIKLLGCWITTNRIRPKQRASITALYQLNLFFVFFDISWTIFINAQVFK